VTVSQETNRSTAADLGRSSAQPRRRRLAAAALNWLRKDLFLRTEGGPVGWRKMLLAAACVVAATAHGACALPHVTAYTFVHEWWYVTIPCSKVG
jgi:hypothetical protein